MDRRASDAWWHRTSKAAGSQIPEVAGRSAEDRAFAMPFFNLSKIPA
jgi:hypothetical protein